MCTRKSLNERGVAAPETIGILAGIALLAIYLISEIGMFSSSPFYVISYQTGGTDLIGHSTSVEADWSTTINNFRPDCPELRKENPKLTCPLHR